MLLCSTEHFWLSVADKLHRTQHTGQQIPAAEPWNSFLSITLSIWVWPSLEGQFSFTIFWGSLNSLMCTIWLSTEGTSASPHVNYQRFGLYKVPFSHCLTSSGFSTRLNCVRAKVITAVTMKITVFWDQVPWGWGFRGTCCLHSMCCRWRQKVPPKRW